MIFRLNYPSCSITWLSADLVDHITPWWTLLAEASNAINIWQLWEGMVGKWSGAGTEPNACPIPANPVQLSTLVGEYSIWLYSIGYQNCLEIVFLDEQAGLTCSLTEYIPSNESIAYLCTIVVTKWTYLHPACYQNPWWLKFYPLSTTDEVTAELQ